MKKCTWCGEIKNRSNFPVEEKRYDGLYPWCRSCCNEKSKEWKRKNKHKTKITTANWRKRNPDRDRENHLKKKYSLTISLYDSLLKSQLYGCAICYSETPGGRGRFHVDHDHESGNVRGLLCHRCNVAIGLLMDNETFVESALNYIRLHKSTAKVLGEVA